VGEGGQVGGGGGRLRLLDGRVGGNGQFGQIKTGAGGFRRCGAGQFWGRSGEFGGGGRDLGRV
jgi:hypothetical protein